MAYVGPGDAQFVLKLLGINQNITLEQMNTSTGVSPVNAEEPSDFVKYANIIRSSVIGATCVLGLFGNLLVILVVLTDKQMKSTINILIFSLAIADLLFVLICAPLSAAHYILPEWSFANVICRVFYYTIYVSVYASVYNLVIMSLYRCLAVLHPIRFKTWISERKTWLVVSVIWIVILSANLPIIVQWDTEQGVEKINSKCSPRLQFTGNGHGWIVFKACFFFFGYFLPLGLIMIMYSLMLKRLLFGAVPGRGNQSTTRLQSNKRVTKMVVIVVIVFALCWLPSHAVFFWWEFGTIPSEPYAWSIAVATDCLAFFNSCVNPILYAFLSQKFQQSFRKFLCCSKH